MKTGRGGDVRVTLDPFETTWWNTLTSMAVNVQRPYECALEAFDARDYANADKLAEWVVSRFPYSPFGRKAEVLRADILFAKRKYVLAAEAYDLRDHPADEGRDAVEAKRNTARDSIR